MNPNHSNDDPERIAGPREVRWTALDIMGFFSDAVDRDQPPNSRIIGYRRDARSGALLALIENVGTGQVLFYCLEIESLCPYPVRYLDLVP